MVFIQLIIIDKHMPHKLIACQQLKSYAFVENANEFTVRARICI